MRIGIMGLHYGHIRGMISSALAAEKAEIVGIVEPNDELYEVFEADWTSHGFRPWLT